MNWGSGPMCEFTTPDGDAPLHEPILREGSDDRALQETRERALREGWTIQQVERCYGPFKRSALKSKR
jgi:hypothetical protein